MRNQGGIKMKITMLTQADFSYDKHVTGMDFDSEVISYWSCLGKGADGNIYEMFFEVLDMDAEMDSKAFANWDKPSDVKLFDYPDELDDAILTANLGCIYVNLDEY